MAKSNKKVNKLSVKDSFDKLNPGSFVTGNSTSSNYNHANIELSKVTPSNQISQTYDKYDTLRNDFYKEFKEVRNEYNVIDKTLTDKITKLDGSALKKTSLWVIIPVALLLLSFLLSGIYTLSYGPLIKRVDDNSEKMNTVEKEINQSHHKDINNKKDTVSK